VSVFVNDLISPKHVFKTSQISPKYTTNHVWRLTIFWVFRHFQAFLAAKSHGISRAGAIFSRVEPLGTRMDTGFSRLAAILDKREVFMVERVRLAKPFLTLCVLNFFLSYIYLLKLLN
jgi:hypothetical protein